MKLKAETRNFYSNSLALLFTFCLISTPLHAEHTEDQHVPIPMMLDKSNPLNTLTYTWTMTDVTQGYPAFNDDTKPNNINRGHVVNGVRSNLFLGMNIWDGATVFANPEIMQGYNISDYLNVENSVNVTTPKMKSSSPYLRLQRLFLQQEINLDNDRSEAQLEGARNVALEKLQNQLTGKVSKNRLRFTIGKFSVADIFDDNIYAHDPSRHFLNWTFNGLDSVDFAWDLWGFTYGGALEWTNDWWTVRVGLFQGSLPGNSVNVDPKPLNQYQAIGEFEIRHDKFFGQPGSIKFIGYQDNGYLNSLGDNLYQYKDTDVVPTIVKNELRRTKLGMGINIQQQIVTNIGFFLRAGVDNKTFDYKDINKSISGGFVLSGKLWNRPLDEFGIGGGYAGMKGVRAVLPNGTIGIEGDGNKNYSAEKNLETYYRIGINDHVDLSFDYQLVANPNLSKNRGPANIFGIRLRTNF